MSHGAMDHTNIANMNGYYDRQYSAEDMQRLANMSSHDTPMGMMGSRGMDSSGMIGGPTMDEIIDQNEKDLQRRRTFHHSNSYDSNQSLHNDHRRSSMLEFGHGDHSDLDGFQFDPSPTQPNDGMQRPGNIAQRRLASQRARSQLSNENLALNTDFSNPGNYNSMPSSSPYGQHMTSADSLGFDMSNEYMNNNLMMGVDFTNNPLDAASNGGFTPRDTYPQPSFTPTLNNSQMQQTVPNPMLGRMHDPGGENHAGSLGSHDMMEKLPNMQVSDRMQKLQMDLSQPAMQIPNPNPSVPLPTPQTISSYDQPSKPPPSANLDVSSDANEVPFQGQNETAQQVVPQYKNAYSSSGFDMLGVLMRVAARPKPQINIGAVDMSCAFVVCDVTQHDLPIVYCSDVFERLTAYTKHEILGRNCRFLQAPDGKITAGVKRNYVDDQSVLRIKNMITQRQETQISLINYRKGGQPFMNLLTMIPITWDTDEVKYYVGFQVDLVEQPTSITNKNPGMSPSWMMHPSATDPI